MDKPRLPNRPWLRLQEAVCFAFYGIAFSRHVATIADLAREDERLAELAYPSLYRSIDVSDRSALEGVEERFDRDLSEAGLAGQVIFRRLDGVSEVEVPRSYFIRPRGFSVLDDVISARPAGDWINNLDNDIESQSLENVLVEKESYIKWLFAQYPREFSPHIEGRHAEQTIESKPKQLRGKAGRKPGSGSYARSDAILLEEMTQLVKTGTVASAEAAARMVAPKAKGGGTLESKATRLAKGYHKRYRSVKI